ncbi:bifunctional hydroxymethylpyrimidine kinase/phosphomethylpyrimidine kinase [Intrasporangium calvum]|uniref:bifunctional hydroxymethylpyrimidine kinase/phosphomethylpyrimidine kinase n=1 Tax=Intrasporangium calvum TaxID=53358 RepID=UPI000DF60042|nr:bifunctional hydroxymethylpyrimidine kinase/phosphomethylpyrimidine kinase [Intrasporangium calvum]AXG13017.1 bifunctional hydroxymethylpyrimidine kinase/phosphomethylpyrimidine kinase [Intrasporangium calvum]
MTAGQHTPPGAGAGRPAGHAPTPPVALTIAGSDSGGGAGIQADLATFAALGVHGASAVTAVTVQDTTGVHGVHALPVDVVLAQVDCVLADLAPTVVKVGMLGEARLALAVARLAAAGRLPRLVVDPVLVSTSGHSLAAYGVTQALRDHLLPHAVLVTPNTDEAAALLDVGPARSVDEQADQAQALRALGATTVVVTGGTVRTAAGADRVDVLAQAAGTHVFRSSEIATDNDHGTGCTFASAAAAFLARGESTRDAVLSARGFVRHALRTSAGWRLGAGRGPVAHTRTTFLDPPASTLTSPLTSQGAPR